MTKKVLITGAAGFLGSHLTELLVRKKFSVIAFDRYNSFNHWGHLENSKYKNKFKMILGDIRDYDSVNLAVKEADIVIHLAALIGIPYSYVSPLAYLRTNVEGTYNVLESSKNNKIKNLLIASTSEVYGVQQYIPIDENHPVIANSPYSASKISADQLAMSYFKSYNQKINIIRPFNIYGPRQSARAIIPTIISQLINKKKLNLGNLYPTRDFTYVEDTCIAIFEIMKNDKISGEIFNIGSGKEISILDLVNTISNVMKVSPKIKKENQRVRRKTSEVMRLNCNYDKIFSMTGWKPKISLNHGIKETVNWLKKNNYYKHDIYNL